MTLFSKTCKILIVDDHDLMLRGTVDFIQENFPNANIYLASHIEDAWSKVNQIDLDLVLLDLSLPQTQGGNSRVEYGLKFLEQLMENYPELNLTIQSSNIKSLIRLIPEIDNHLGGFTIADKILPINTIITRVKWAIEGINYTQEIQKNLEIKPEWIEVLTLAFEDGLQDKAIAIKMSKSQRMFRNYWSKIRDVLGVYPDENQNIRTITQIRARETGLID